MGQLILNANTNSDKPTPEFAVFDTNELNALIERYSNAVDWKGDQSILSLRISTLPECYFSDESGSNLEADIDYVNWHQTITDINQNGLVVIFVHSDDGSELFFEYNAK